MGHMDVHSRTFKSGNSEAIRLPKEIAYGPGTEMVLNRRGALTMIYPKPKRSPAQMVAEMQALGRPAPVVQPRDPIAFPDRPGN
jgi:antitoxin VapB